VLLLACLVYAMDLTVLHLAVPQLSADLEPSSAQLLWIADIYGFMVAGALITCAGDTSPSRYRPSSVELLPPSRSRTSNADRRLNRSPALSEIRGQVLRSRIV
jgi:hypothetical protein